MQLRFIIASFLLLFILNSYSQNNTAETLKKDGIIKGTVYDEQSNSRIPFVPVEVYFSSPTHVPTTLAGGQLSDENGNFTIANLDVSLPYILQIKALGYKVKELPITFENNSNQLDLGQLKLELNVSQLKTIEIDGSEPSLKLEMDKKVYNVDKNPINTGGTAEDVLKNIPSVSVDMDGKVTVNNSSPQLFIDGRPTTLSLDQISADGIENVEVITNPSAKYDASGGTGGIVNITLKKSKRIGYSGNLRASMDMFGKITSGLDFNLRKNKINFFASADYNQRMSKSYGENIRDYSTSYPPVLLSQSFDAIFNGLTLSAKGGVDYSLNKKNTITASYSYNQGKFEPLENFYVQTDSIYDSSIETSSYYRQSDIVRQSYTSNATLLYKYIFSKPKHELTADANYQRTLFKNENYYTTQNFDADSNKVGNPQLQQQFGSSYTQLFTLQSDYVNPLNEKTKLEAGLRAYIKNYNNTTNDYLYDYILATYELLPELTNNYRYTENIYAAYFIYSSTFKKIGIQAGLRTESSYYKGEIIDSSLTFSNQYPFSLFPSIFVSHKKNDKHNFQLGYSRRINRPSFFQITPYIDYTDSLNVKQGNPSLQPEFTNTAEFNYQYSIDNNNTLLATVYFKNTMGIITSYQEIEYNNFLGKEIILNTYENANSSYSYGIEVISKNKIKNSIDVTASINLCNAIVDGSNLESNLINELFSWSSKLNVNIKLPFNLSYQLSGNYQSKMITPVSGSSNGRENNSVSGSSWWNVQSSMIQGYSLPRYDIDMGIKFEFLKNKMASLTFNVSDVFRTKRQANFYQTPYYTQSVYRIRNPQFYRLTFSYRFGKQDPSLLKRKTSGSEGGESEI